MSGPTEKTLKKLFALSGNRCAFPDCQLPIINAEGIVTGEVCHIKAKSTHGPRHDERQSIAERNGFENLLLLCSHHHKEIDSLPDVYTTEQLTIMKHNHETMNGRLENESDTFIANLIFSAMSKAVSAVNGSGNLAINSPGAIQAHTLNLKTSHTKQVVAPPPGTIGADQKASRYIEYLIQRYNKFAGADYSRKTSFSYGAISKNITDKFGTKWQLQSIQKCEEIIFYLQNRIEKTRIAKMNRANGVASFSTFEEYFVKHE